MKNININNPIIQAAQYGTYTPLMFTVIDRQHPSYSRIDRYKSNITGDENDEIVWTDKTTKDLTPIFNGKYNSECYGCFTGHAHTENNHKSKI